MGTEGLSAAHNRAEVMGVGDTIERHQQRRFADAAAAINEAAQIKGVGGSGLEHDALVHGSISELTEARPGDLLHQHTASFRFTQQLHEAGLEAHLRRAPDAMDRPIALKSGLGGMATPDQIIGWAGIETLGFAAGGINNQRAGGDWLIALTPQRAAIRAAILEGRARAKAALALGTPRPALGATATAAGPIKTRAELTTAALSARAIRTGAIGRAAVRTTAIKTAAVAAGAIGAPAIRSRTLEARPVPTRAARTIETALGAGTIAITEALRSLSALRPAAKAGALAAVGTITALPTLRTPFTTRSERTARATTGIGPAWACGARSRRPRALALVPAAIKTGAHASAGKGFIGSAFSRCASSWARRLGS